MSRFNLFLFSYLTEEMEVSYYGSKLGIINGQTGKWIVRVTDSLTEIFANLTAYSDPCKYFCCLFYLLFRIEYKDHLTAVHKQ